MDRHLDLKSGTHPRALASRCALFITAMVFAGLPAAFGAGNDSGTFANVYEPSGLAPLPDGRLLIVDDEPDHALHLVTTRRDADGISMHEQVHLDPPRGVFANLKLGKLDDLEGVAHDAVGRMYVVTSQDKAGIKSSGRRKLVRFVVDGTRMSDAAIISGLRDQLLDAFPELRQAMSDGGKHGSELDVEAIAFDRKRDRLILGLRSPRLDDQAALVTIDAPDDWLDNDAPLSATLLRVDLEEGGVRAMAYDDTSDALLIVSRRERGNAPYLLWSLDANIAHAARPVLLDDSEALENVEGITMLHDGILFVRDDGKRNKGKRGSWFFKTRTALGLE